MVIMIEITNLTKTFNTSAGQVEALKNISLKIETGDIYGIIGMSGAGKSTLVRCINLLERPDSGSVKIDGLDLMSLSERDLRKARRDITMIFQSFNLLMQRNCLDNICFPLELEGMKKAESKKRAYELLETVGLADKAKAYPAMLSGGQQQRIAIARALATNPKVLLCDEATSALDPSTTSSVLDLLCDINRRLGINVIVITHQMSVIEQICKSVAILDHGVIAESGSVEGIFSHPKSEAAKRLVFSETDAVPPTCGESFLRVVFNGANASKTPLIAQMALEKGIKANIAYASTKSIGDKAYGTMLLTVPGGDENIRDAVAYLSATPNVTVEEVGFND